MEDLDENHVMITSDEETRKFIEAKIDEWNEKNTYQAPTR